MRWILHHRKTNAHQNWERNRMERNGMNEQIYHFALFTHLSRSRSFFFSVQKSQHIFLAHFYFDSEWERERETVHWLGTVYVANSFTFVGFFVVIVIVVVAGLWFTGLMSNGRSNFASIHSFSWLRFCLRCRFFLSFFFFHFRRPKWINVCPTTQICSTCFI